MSTSTGYTGEYFRIGDPVWYRGAWGSVAPVKGRIIGEGMNKGRRVYDVDLGFGGSTAWGYADQFTARLPERLGGF